MSSPQPRSRTLGEPLCDECSFCLNPSLRDLFCARVVAYWLVDPSASNDSGTDLGGCRASKLDSTC